MTFQRIHALPLHLANQIAAGEVVERPASVLKELIENALDADATQINIEILGAGKELIRVTDNGAGIHHEDLPLALSRHATSKLHSSDDLAKISSLGFRGEALPSIASVSRLLLTSRQQDNEYAWQIHSDETEVSPASHPHGTSVSVAELFFNLPARRRFLRSDKTELNHLTTTLYRLALSRFDVGFNCNWGNHSVLQLPALPSPDQHAKRLLKICGKSFVSASVYLEQQFEDIELHGWIALPEAHRAQTDVQYFFINGRVIKDRLINHAVRQAYGDLLPQGRQPAYVLYLSLPLDKVDVNVHPTKHEVRFREARLIHGLISQAIQEALASEQTSPAQVTLELDTTSTTKQVRETQPSYHSTQRPRVTTSSKTTLSRPSLPANSTQDIILLSQRYALLPGDIPKLIDIQLAEQSIRRQQLETAFIKGTLASRPILVPMTWALSSVQFSLLQQHQSLLAEHALELVLQQQSVSIRRIPYLLTQIDLKLLIDSVCEALAESVNARSALLSSWLELIPLSSAISKQQAQQTIEALTSENLEQANYCCKLDPTTLSSLFSA